MDVAGLADRYRAAIEDTGLLLVHDQDLPSATAIAAGEPVRGSWWSHPLAHAIYDALQLLEDDVFRAKVLRGKVTLVAERLWPALASLGGSRGRWQTDGLGTGARELLATVDGARAPMRTPAGATKAVGVLERRLLICTDEVHTESGRHAKVLQTWAAWVESEPRARGAVEPHDAVAAFERATVGWPPIKGRLLPWSG